jgi:hypothetical protein
MQTGSDDPEEKGEDALGALRYVVMMLSGQSGPQELPPGLDAPLLYPGSANP